MRLFLKSILSRDHPLQVALNLFSQKDLIEAIAKAERRVKREKKEKEKQQKINNA